MLLVIVYLVLINHHEQVYEVGLVVTKSNSMTLPPPLTDNISSVATIGTLLLPLITSTLSNIDVYVVPHPTHTLNVLGLVSG